MPKQRRLTDLYVVGREVTVDDGQGDPVTVFTRKLSSVDHETALRRANSARSRSFAIKHEPDGDDYQALVTLVADYRREDLITYLVEDLKGSRGAIVEAQVADEDEWKDDGYVQGLKDDWAGGTDKIYEVDSSDAEAKRVFDELNRFDAQVAAALAHEVDDFRDELDTRDDEALREAVLDKLVEVRSSIAWLTEYRKCEVWLSIRDTDRKTRYFENREEVDELSPEVFAVLQESYRLISVEPTEGKDSAATLPSSPSSAQPERAETGESSGLTGAAA